MNELVDLISCMWKLEPVYATACLFNSQPLVPFSLPVRYYFPLYCLSVLLNSHPENTLLKELMCNVLLLELAGRGSLILHFVSQQQNNIEL